MGNNGEVGPRSLKGLETLSLREIVAADYPGPDWLIEGIIPQGCFLFAGRAKIGKSWLLLQTGITLAVGGKLLGHESLGRFKVVYIAAEDEPGRIKLRFQRYRVSEPPENLHFICRDQLRAYAAEFAEHYSLAEFIEIFLNDNPDVRAVFLDTESKIRMVWDGGTVKRDVSLTRHDYAEVSEFDEIAHRQRAFIVLVNHTSKRRSAEWIDIHELINRTNTSLAGGSGSWIMADPAKGTAIRKDGCAVLGIRGRDLISGDQELAVQQDEFGLFQSLGPYAEHLQTETERDILEALEQLSHAEPEVWKSSKQLATYLSRGQGSIQRAITRMVKAGRTSWNGYLFEAKPKLGLRLIRK